MESQPLDMEEDDFAKVYRLSYPPFLFTEPLLSAGDGELLRPVIMAIYALGMNATSSNFSLVNLDPMKMDAERSEYTLTASIDGDIQIAYVAWNALLTVSPARICSVIVKPYFHELRNRPLMQVHVKLRSERGPLSARFALYRRRDTSVLFARTQPLVLVDNNGVIMASNVAPIASGPNGEAPPDAPALTDIQRTHEQLIATARAYTQEQLAKLKHECGRILKRTREREGVQSLEYDNYSLDASVAVSMSAHQVNRGMVTWRLPVGVSFDIMELVMLLSLIHI